MRRAVIAAVCALGFLALVAPSASARDAERSFDDVYAHQAQSKFNGYSITNPLLVYHPKVAVKLYSKKQTNGIGFVVTQINLDAWKDGFNPADVPCPDYLDNDGVEGDLHLDRYDTGIGWRYNVREWHVILGNGDGCHEELLGGANSVSINATGIRARFDPYVIRIHDGDNITGKATWVNRVSTSATGWTFACGGDNVVYCDQS